MISISDSQPAIQKAAMDLDGVVLMREAGILGEGRYRQHRRRLQQPNLPVQRCTSAC
ncbi:hypothetical protein ACVWYH_008861 [Bradyrhizobium sp. GM24.11]